MHRIVVIANPAASQFTGGSHRDVMATLNRVAEVGSIWPGSPAEAAERARESAESGADIVVAMGGDGIVHHVSQGVVGTEASLGVIPVGTTNVFARLMGIPSKPVKAARLLVTSPQIRRVGVATMTLHRGSTQTVHHSIFACGFGLDAAVVERAEKEPYRKYRFGSVHYATSAFATALQDFPRRRPHVTVHAGDREAYATAAMIQFREIYTYFGKVALKIAPAHPDPMTVLVVKRLRRRHIPRIAVTLFAGRALESIPEMEVWRRVGQFEWKADPPVKVQADGEALGMVDGGTVEWAPDALAVIVPPSPPPR
ncbi:MAG TPA: diacylglycerol kinase family protein [Acidimicrobiia bacterium]|nr:diacylglycerol kinase family protein [Acidimicrobiia bacterium]